MLKYLFAPKLYLLAYLLLLSITTYSQEEEYSKNDWDNKLYLSNKISWGTERWIYSGEIQIRLEDNMQSLDNWYVEGVASYLLSKKIEFVPDLRLIVKPNETIIRPGFGIFYKLYSKKVQYVNQVKWQIDIDNPDGNTDNALRYVLYINYKLNEKLVGNFLAGALYRWTDDFSDFELIRTGPGITYIINDRHSFSFNYFLSIDNNHIDWEWSGIPSIQLKINIDKDYKFLPAKYFSF